MSQQTQFEVPTLCTWSGIVLDGDNIDKSVNARYQTLGILKQVSHYFNSYAVLDRCDFTHLPEFQPHVDRNSFDVTCLLQSNNNFVEMLCNLSILVGKMLTTFIPGFAKYKSISGHKKHKYSTEMESKSDVVGL